VSAGASGASLRRRYGHAKRLRAGKKAAAEVQALYALNYEMLRQDGHDELGAHLSARQNVYDTLSDSITNEQISIALPAEAPESR